MTIKAVVFDIGGVIVTDGPDMAQVAATLGLDPRPETVARVSEAVWGERDAYDLGMSDEEYWRRVAHRAGARPPADAVVERLTASDVGRWGRPRADVVDLIRDLHACGLRIGVLSNAPVALAAGFCAQEWTALIDVRVFSCATRAAKPAPAAYAPVIEAFDLPAGDIVFFDDRPGNVDAGHEVGLVAHLWDGADDARSFIAALTGGGGQVG